MVKLSRPIASLFGAWLLVMLPSCSGSIGTLCQSSVDCEGGNDKDVDACVAEVDGAEAIASAYDCSDAFDKLLDCVAEKSVCKDPPPGTTGRKNFTSGDACKGEEAAYETCQKAASARGQ